MSDTTVGAAKVVSIHYTLKLDDGQVVDSSSGREPLDYLHGVGGIVPGLEQALEGKALGEKVQVAVAPTDGYGERVDDAVQTVPRGAFPPDARLEKGITFQAVDEQQNPLLGTIVEVSDDSVTVDFNHPLAGLNLNFEVEITAIRAATQEEQDRGQVHGADGQEPG